MNFDQKLNTLMHLFKINNSKLSRGIKVDASLISRWRSGERKISPNSPHIPVLANYFLKLNSYQYQKEYLERIISARLPEQQRKDEASRIHVLTEWLVSDEPLDAQPDEQPEQLAQSSSLISRMTEILLSTGEPQAGGAEADARDSQKRKLTGEIAARLSPGIVHNETFKLYEGREGKRQAALHLMNTALNATEKLEIFITTEDDQRWLTEDPDFLQLWADLTLQVLKAGHQITMIHVLNRRFGDIMNMLAYWVPFHLSGRMQSLFYPRFGDRRIRQTLLVIRGKMAVVSNSIADSNAAELTFAYHDAAATDHFSRIFMSHASQCRPLFAVYNRTNLKTFFNQSIEISKKSSAAYNIRHQLNSHLLPSEILKPYLPQSLGQEIGSLMAEWLDSQQQFLINRAGNDKFIDILPLSLLEKIQEQRQAYLPCNVTFAERPIPVSTADTITWLRRTIDTLQHNTHYEIYLCPNNSAIDLLRANIVYRENIIAYFSPAIRDCSTSSMIMLCENSILRSLSYYFDDFIQQIPATLRNKADVIQRLERLAANLQNNK